MSKADPDFDVLDELLAQVWEQGADEALYQQINDLLDGDQRAQRRYLEQQLLHADLLDCERRSKSAAPGGAKV